MAQEYAKSGTCSSAASSEPFTWTQRQQIQLQQLFELLFTLALRLTLTISASKGQGRQESQPLAVAIQVTLSHTTTPLKEQELQPLAFDLAISLTSTHERQELLGIAFSSSSPCKKRKLQSLSESCAPWWQRSELLTFAIATTQKRWTQITLAHKKAQPFSLSFSTPPSCAICILRLTLSLTIPTTSPPR
jgi:hypothetical protein